MGPLTHTATDATATLPTLARLARRRAAQRWSALVSAPGSRLARQMWPHLGAERWDEFVEHANRHYKAGWLRAFAPASGVLRCVGTLDGAPCPHAAAVDLRAGAGAGDGSGSGSGSGESVRSLGLQREIRPKGNPEGL